LNSALPTSPTRALYLHPMPPQPLPHVSSHAPSETPTTPHATPSSALTNPTLTRTSTRPATPFVSAMLARGGRRSLAAAAGRADSSTPGSATARAIRDLVCDSPFEYPPNWLLNERTMFNWQINKKTFPRESREKVFHALESDLELAVIAPQEDPLAFRSSSLRLRPVPKTPPKIISSRVQRETCLSVILNDVQDFTGWRDY